MKKKNIKYYAIIVFVLLLIVVFEILKPKPLDWRFTLEQKDKISYGTYVLHNTLEDIFPDRRIRINKKTTYQLSLNNDIEKNNIIYITESFSPDELDAKTILRLIEKGNNVFISSHFYKGFLSDTLKIKTKYASLFLDSISKLNFYNKTIKQNKDFEYGKSSGNISFSSFDTANFEILAHSKENEAIFIRQQIGNGYLYLNTTPEVYTNYAMIAENNYEFAYYSLSYLPIYDIVWDEYYKPFRKSEKSTLSYIFANPAFKTAYYLLLIVTVLFVIFTARRKQRIIPVIKPHKNSSLQFVKTIGRLYFHTKNHKDIALKKYNHLHHFILNRYNINIPDNKNVSYDIIAEKTGVEIEIIKKVLSAVARIHKLEQISRDQLNSFNNYIEDFYETCK